MVSHVRNDAELKSAQGALAFFESMLRGLSDREPDASSERVAGDLIYDILRIRRQIDDYIGLTDYALAHGLPSVEDDDRVRPRPAARPVSAAG